MKTTATVIRPDFNGDFLSEATELVADDCGLSVLLGDKTVAVFAPGQWSYAYLKEQAE